MSEILTEATEPTGAGLEVGAEVTEAPAEGAAEAAAPEAAAPSWTPDSPEFQQAVSQQLEQHLQQLARQAEWEEQQAQGQQQGGFEFDPFSDNPGEQLAQLVGSILDQKLAPLTPMVEETQNAWAQQQVDGMLDSFQDIPGLSLKDSEGKPLEGQALEAAKAAREDAERMAAGFMPSLPDNAPPWARQQAIHQALRQGAEARQRIYSQAFQAGQDAYKASMQGITGQQADAPVSGAALERAPGGSYDEIASRYQRQAEAREALLRGGNAY